MGLISRFIERFFPERGMRSRLRRLGKNLPLWEQLIAVLPRIVFAETPEQVEAELVSRSELMCDEAVDLLTTVAEFADRTQPEMVPAFQYVASLLDARKRDPAARIVTFRALVRLNELLRLLASATEPQDRIRIGMEAAYLVENVNPTFCCYLFGVVADAHAEVSVGEDDHYEQALVLYESIRARSHELALPGPWFSATVRKGDLHLQCTGGSRFVHIAAARSCYEEALASPQGASRADDVACLRKNLEVCRLWTNDGLRMSVIQGTPNPKLADRFGKAFAHLASRNKDRVREAGRAFERLMADVDCSVDPVLWAQSAINAAICARLESHPDHARSLYLEVLRSLEFERHPAIHALASTNLAILVLQGATPVADLERCDELLTGVLRTAWANASRSSCVPCARTLARVRVRRGALPAALSAYWMAISGIEDALRSASDLDARQSEVAELSTVYHDAAAVACFLDDHLLAVYLLERSKLRTSEPLPDEPHAFQGAGLDEDISDCLCAGRACAEDLLKRTLRAEAPFAYVAATRHGALTISATRRSETEFALAAFVDRTYSHDDISRDIVLASNAENVGSMPAIIDSLMRSLCAKQRFPRRLLAALGEAFQKPLRSMIGGREPSRVAVIPVGVLHHLPLHAATYDGVTAIEHFSFQYLPSARAWLEQSPQSPAPSAVGVIAGPRSHGAVRLAYLGSEIAFLRRLLPEGDTIDGDACTETAAVEMFESQDVVHVAGHGAEGAAGFSLAGGVPFCAESLSRVTRKKRRLAVLVVCRSGAADPRLPDEGRGLPAALLARGFEGAVGTLWPVDDLASALFSIAFYDNWLRGGIGVVEAVRSAQDWLRRSTVNEVIARLVSAEADPRLADALSRYGRDERVFEDPFWWAGFYYAGA